MVARAAVACARPAARRPAVSPWAVQQQVNTRAVEEDQGQLTCRDLPAPEWLAPHASSFHHASTFLHRCFRHIKNQIKCYDGATQLDGPALALRPTPAATRKRLRLPNLRARVNCRRLQQLPHRAPILRAPSRQRPFRRALLAPRISHSPTETRRVSAARGPQTTLHRRDAPSLPGCVPLLEMVAAHLWAPSSTTRRKGVGGGDVAGDGLKGEGKVSLLATEVGISDSPAIRVGFGSDTHENGFECHYLPYFNPNTDTNTNIVGYEYKTDSSNSDLYSDTYLIWNIAS